MPKHPHADKMALYAEDALETDNPWERWECRQPDGTIWHSLPEHPIWDEIIEYRRKPRTITINGHEVPEPVREPLEDGQGYFLLDITRGDFADKFFWTGGRIDKKWLEHGLIHLTEEAAKAHAEALLSFTKKGD